MWWDHGGWGPMYGWWFMPIFGLLFMLIFLYVMFRIFNRDRYSYGPFSDRHPGSNQEQEKLREEVKALRREVKELRQRQ